MKEIWEDIKNYEGLYQISNLGRIKSLCRIVNGVHGRSRKNINFLIEDKILKLSYDKNKYYIVGLYKNGTRKMYRVHRLVATAFLKNRYNLPQVNHRDGCKTNNKIDNLEWCTAKYNTKHAYDLGLIKKHDINFELLTFLYIRKGFTVSMISEILNIGSTTIRKFIKEFDLIKEDIENYPNKLYVVYDNNGNIVIKDKKIGNIAKKLKCKVFQIRNSIYKKLKINKLYRCDVIDVRKNEIKLALEEAKGLGIDTMQQEELDSLIKSWGDMFERSN